MTKTNLHQREENLPEPPALDPAKLLDHLNREVYGQKWAKEKLTDALVWNQERLRFIREGVSPSELPPKANVLLIGPTGCGKTFLTSTAAKFCRLPYYYTAATEYSAPGYVGRNLDSMVRGLVDAAGSVTAAERGIIFIDEVDKIRRRNFGGQDDVGGESVQHGLLTMLEGATVKAGTHSVDTSGITFVAGGAFSSISGKLGPEGERQFGAEDLIKFGLIPEFIGRFPLRVGLSPLQEADLRKLLLECRSSTLLKTKNLFKRHGIDLVVDDAVIDSIIESAKRMGTGARSLDEMVKDRCLGLMSRISELRQKGVTQVVLREDGIKEGKIARALQRETRPEVHRTAAQTANGRITPGSEEPNPHGPENPTKTPPTWEEKEGRSAMTAGAWVTVTLACVLVALGFGAWRSPSPAPEARNVSERVRGEETPRLWRELQRSSK